MAARKNSYRTSMECNDIHNDIQDNSNEALVKGRETKFFVGVA